VSAARPTHRRRGRPAAPAGGPSPAPWRLAASSALTTAALSVVGATAPDLREALGVSTAALTLAFIGQMLGALAGSWIAGRARYGVLEVSPLALLAAAALAAAALAPTLALLVAAMMLVGLGSMAANVGAQAETMRRAGERRAQALSRFHVYGGAGAAVFPLAFAALLAAGVPHEAAFVLIGAGYVGYGWINRRLRVVPPPRAAGTTHRACRRAGSGRWRSPCWAAACSLRSRSTWPRSSSTAST
jgi:MFS family permease